ncbi:hypothetical protein [Marinithermus hydrothermalis]|uniref:hypothetical protein n=1 Tax=Marinithermus hydrothermalis TaxID=186192 RepID=UPI0002DDBDB5|nr:hypothetical protein [Marinithermus hydrothermalis]
MHERARKSLEGLVEAVRQRTELAQAVRGETVEAGPELANFAGVTDVHAQHKRQPEDATEEA